MKSIIIHMSLANKVKEIKFVCKCSFHGNVFISFLTCQLCRQNQFCILQLQLQLQYMCQSQATNNNNKKFNKIKSKNKKKTESKTKENKNDTKNKQNESV